MSNLLDKAANYCVLWHSGQKRKYINIPYASHCFAVMEIVSEVSQDENMLCASLLHDSVEDCENIELETINALFNPRITELVDWLTDVSRPGDGNRAKRKAIDRQHTADAPPEAKTIKLADLIHNTSSITKYDPDFAKVYMKEKCLLLDVLSDGDSRLFDRAHRLLIDYQTEQVQQAIR